MYFHDDGVLEGVVEMTTHKLLKSKMGITIGVVWGVNLLLLSLMFMFFGIGGTIIGLLSGFYVGYSGTLLGGIVGFVLGFLHGYVLGMVSDHVIPILTHK